MIHATSAYLMPHPPIIVPAVGRDGLRRCASTRQACAEVAARVAAIAPARLVLVSPHAPRLAKAAAVFATSRISGSLARFGAAGARVDLLNDLDLVSRLTAAGRPFGPVEAPLDHGALVPLWYLADAGWSGPTAVVGLPGRADRDELRRQGEALGAALEALPGPIVLIASGDMSHRVTPGAPAGYDPRAVGFDLTVRDLVAAGDLDGLFELDDDLREAAAEDVIDPVLVVASAIGFDARGTAVLSYEHPFGVGYLVAVLHEAGAAARGKS